MNTLLKRLLFFSLPIVITVGAGRVKTEQLPPPELKEAKIISRALHFVKKNYVDPEQLDGDRLLKKAFRELERGIPPLRLNITDKTIRMAVGEHEGKIPMANPITSGKLPGGKLPFDYLIPVLRQVLGFLDRHYTGRVEEKDREYLSLAGIIDALDPHSNFLPPKIFNEFKIGTKGNFGGLGIVIGLREGQLTVIAPIEGTPAYEVGIRANDKIMQIGEEAAINMTLTEAVEKLRGPVGSQVSLVIQRPASAVPIHVTLKRALIRIKSVGSTVLSDGKVVLLKIKNFQEDTSLEVEKQLKKAFQNPKLKGIILDLRNDPGGLLDQSVEVADLFLESGVIVKTVGANVSETEQASPGGPYEKVPMAVLINEGSASAAEIVAGALQQNDRACVLGARSFGKGSVQTVYDLKDGSALKLTIAKYLTANDYEVQAVGITPNINLIPISVGKDQVDLFENIKTREVDLKDRDDDEEKESAVYPPARFNLKYLSKEKSDEPDKEENAAKIVLEQDTPVNLAEALILLKDGNTRCSSLTPEEISSLLGRWEKMEETKLEAALKKINVPWGTGKKQGKPEARVTIQLRDNEGNPVQSLLPGQTGKLFMSVENQGKGPFYRLSAVTKSDDPLFSNLEFPLGEIHPGDKKEWTVPLKIQEMASERSEPVTFIFHEFYDHTPANQEYDLTIAAPAKPHFSYSYTLIDGPEKGTKGNSNNQPESGETVGIKVTVKNDGPGASTKPVINVKNNGDEEVFLEKGRLELSPLPAGGSASGLLLVKIQQDKKIDLELFITDTLLGEDLSDHLIWNGTSLTPPPGVEHIPPRLTLEPANPVLKTSGSSYRLKGVATDNEKMLQVYIFVNSEKVFYASQAGDPKTLHFETTTKLKKGFNVITVIAQDDRELTTQRQWIVWRK